MGLSIKRAWKNIADRAKRQGTGLGMNQGMALVTFVFHVCLLCAPIFLLAHNMMLEWSWGFAFPSMPESLSDILTMVVLACGLFFLGRRILVPKVRVLTTARDIGLFVLVFFPFVTGFIAYHQFFAYKTVLCLHIFFSELLVALIPFTMLNHMLYFFFNRFLIQDEQSLYPGARRW